MLFENRADRLTFDLSSSLKERQIKKRSFCFNCSVHYILWGDEIFGRHTLLSRGWGTQDKLSVEPTLLMVRPTRVDH